MSPRPPTILQQIATLEVKLELAAAGETAADGWRSLTRRNGPHSREIVLRLLRVLERRGATIAEFMKARWLGDVPGDVPDLEAALAMLDYLLERTKPSKLPHAAEFALANVLARISSLRDQAQFAFALPSAKKWWKALERHYQHGPLVLLFLLQELVEREATVEEYFAAFEHSAKNKNKLEVTFLAPAPGVKDEHYERVRAECAAGGIDLDALLERRASAFRPVGFDDVLALLAMVDFLRCYERAGRGLPPPEEQEKRRKEERGAVRARFDKARTVSAVEKMVYEVVADVLKRPASSIERSHNFARDADADQGDLSCIRHRIANFAFEISSEDLENLCTVPEFVAFLSAFKGLPTDDSDGSAPGAVPDSGAGKDALVAVLGARNASLNNTEVRWYLGKLLARVAAAEGLARGLSDVLATRHAEGTNPSVAAERKNIATLLASLSAVREEGLRDASDEEDSLDPALETLELAIEAFFEHHRMELYTGEALEFSSARKR